MLKNRLSRRSSGGQFESESVNPMDGVANLADVMLVLAVGIMLALVMAYKLNISDLATQSANPDPEESDMTEIDVVGDEDPENVDDSGLTEYGRVYIDEDGNYYIVEE